MSDIKTIIDTVEVFLDTAPGLEHSIITFNRPTGNEDQKLEQVVTIDGEPYLISVKRMTQDDN